MSGTFGFADQDVLDALPLAVIQFDGQRRMVLANRRMLALAGVEAMRMSPGLTLEESVRLFALRGVYGPGDPERQVTEVLALDRTRPFRRMLRHADGTTLEMRVQPMPEGGFTACLIDVSHMAGPLDAAVADLRRLETLFDALGIGVALYDRNETLMLRNTQYAQLIGLPASRVQPGMAAADVLHRLVEHGEMQAADAEGWLAGTRDDTGPASVEQDRLRPDGQSLRIRRARLADGSRLVEVSDVTALRNAQSEAQRRATLLDTLLLALPVGVLVWGADDRVRFVNAAYSRIMADSPVAIGDHIADVVRRRSAAGEFGAEPAEAVLARMLAEAHLPRAFERQRPNGDVLSIRHEPLADGGRVTVLTDITDLHRTRAEVTQRAEMLSLMLEGMQHGIALYGEDGRVRAVNRLAREMCGLTPEEFRPGSHMADLREIQIARGEYGDAAQTAAFLARRPDVKWDGPDRYIRRRANGQVVEVVTMPAEGGGFLRTFADVTALHDAEASAARRARTVSAMLEGIRHGLLMYGPDHRLVAANSRAERMTQLPDLQKRIGMPLSEILAQQHAAGNFGEGAEADALLQWFRGLDRTRPQLMHRALPDGRVLEMVSDPTPDGGFIIALSDVTRLVRAEAEAKRRGDVLAAMLENIRHGICLFDEQERVLAANARFHQIIGIRAEAVAPGTPFREFVAELLVIGEFGAGGEAAAIAAERIARDRRRPWRKRRHRPGGGWVEIVSDPIPGGGFVLTYTDVTEEHEARATLDAARLQAEAASAAKSRFLATMSHELRTPLTAVIGFAETLQLSPNAPNRDEYISAIRDAGRHLLTLINDILDVASAEAGGLSVREERVAVAPVMAEVLRVMQAAANASGVSLVLEAPAGLPELRADGMRLRQVLLNLISNAVKFTLSGGEVRLSGRVLDDGAVQIEVRDNGIGMPGADIPRAFEPFSQLDSGLSRKYSGSGIGLSLSRALAEAQGASLSLRSRPGEGTRATLRFPPDRIFQPERISE